MTLDSILNVVIPIGIFVAIMIFIYTKAKKPIDNFFRMVKGWFQNKDDYGGEKIREISDYKIEYRGI